MTTLTFQNTTLSVINQNNKTFINANDLGKALEYANPEASIRKIYNSNADEFTPEMTALIEMQTNGGKQQVRIFSLRGAHLIAMFARTKVAKEFRRWVLDILDREVAKDTISPEQQHAIQTAVQQAHHRTGLSYAEIYRQLKAAFSVAKYDQLPADQFGNVMAFIANLQKIEPIAPLVEPTISLALTQTELRDLINTWMLFTRFAESVHPLLNQIRPIVHGNLYSLPDFNLNRCDMSLRQTHPTILKLLDVLPKTQRLHNSRQQIQGF